MSDSIRYPLVLGIITVLSALTLGITDSATREQIQLQALLERNRALVAVLGVEVTDPDNPPWKASAYDGTAQGLGKFTVFEVPGENGSLYAAQGQGQGYSSKVRVIVAFTPGIEQGLEQAVVRSIRIVSQTETPGLGSKCQDEAFERQYQNLPFQILAIDRGLRAYRDPEGDPTKGIAAITGATITTNATLKAVRQAAEKVRYHIENRQGSE